MKEGGEAGLMLHPRLHIELERKERLDWEIRE
jgi:hypothetical protein